jgi:hypothetical protein
MAAAPELMQSMMALEAAVAASRSRTRSHAARQDSGVHLADTSEPSVDVRFLDEKQTSPFDNIRFAHHVRC